jgi:formate C-acetyltransferase
MEIQTEKLKSTSVIPDGTQRADDIDANQESTYQDVRMEILEKMQMPEVCVERLRLITESYKETEAEPMIIRRAKAFHKILTEIPLTIDRWQKLVGNYASKPLMTSIYPEYTAAFILEEMDRFATREGDRFFISDENKKILKEITPYWIGKTVEDAVNNMTPESVKTAERNSLISSAVKNEGIGQFLPDYEIVLTKGIQGIIEDLEDAKENADTQKGDYLQRMLFYDAVLISCKAVLAYAKRFAELAASMAEKEEDATRKAELKHIASVCQIMPANPATSFPEALQSFWFMHILMYVEAGGTGITMGRFDQYMYPYYKRDINSGQLTPESAKDWLRNLWFNLNQTLTFYPEKTAQIWAGNPFAQQPELGGVKTDGTDATNELSDLILEVESEVSLQQPDLAIIYHQKMKDSFLTKACKLLPLGGKPKFFNQELSIMHLLGKGATLEEAKQNGAFVGCVEANLAGMSWGPNNCGFVSLAKGLELALNNGVCPLTGEQVGPKTGSSEEFTSFEEFKEAVKEQVANGVKQHMILNHAIEISHRELVPLHLESVMVKGCVEKGKDLTAGGAHLNKPAIEGVGLANLADSLMAIKKFVYDEITISMKDLVNALKTNFEGQESLRKKLINDAPKYGNDIDEVDYLAREMAQFFCKEAGKYTSPRGVTYCGGLYSVSSHGGLGLGVGATPDGRKEGEPLADGLSPSQGACKNGPTAVINSVCKLDHASAYNGTLLNMKFPTECMQSDIKLRAFVNMLKTFMSLGGYHAQFNVVDTKTLRDAQENPEKYPELLVRVAAYVALFTQLPKNLQDDVIERSEIKL